MPSNGSVSGFEKARKRRSLDVEGIVRLSTWYLRSNRVRPYKLALCFLKESIGAIEKGDLIQCPSCHLLAVIRLLPLYVAQNFE